MTNSRVTIHILGCGNAFASGGRFHTCFLVTACEFSFLLDCGASSIVPLKKSGISLSSIDAIVLSHLHGDHAGGIPFVVMARRIENPDVNPIKIYGPSGTRSVLDQLFRLLFPEADAAPLFEYFEYGQGMTSTDTLSILALHASHVPETHPHSVRIAFRNKIIAFSGDTAWHDGLIGLSAKADIFLCECTNMHPVRNHMSYMELLAHRDLLTPRRMILTHMDDDMLQMENCVFERGYDGQKIILA